MGVGEGRTSNLESRSSDSHAASLLEYCKGVSGIPGPLLEQSVGELQITLVGWEIFSWGDGASSTGLIEGVVGLVSKG